jgi:hypothetical protein
MVVIREDLINVPEKPLWETPDRCVFSKERPEWSYFDFDWFQRGWPDTTETVNHPTILASLEYTSVKHEMNRCPTWYDRFDHFTELLSKLISRSTAEASRTKRKGSPSY